MLLENTKNRKEFWGEKGFNWAVPFRLGATEEVKLTISLELGKVQLNATEKDDHEPGAKQRPTKGEYNEN